MRAGLLRAVGLAIVLLAIGCRTPKPELKPTTTADVLTTPPSEKRFDDPNASYPKEAFIDRDQIKKNTDQDIAPAMGKSMQGGH